MIDPRTIVPLDRAAILRSVAKTGRLVIVDEAHESCSVAAEIAAIVADEGWDLLKAPIKRVTSANTPIPFSPPLEQFVMPSEQETRRRCPRDHPMSTDVVMPKFGLTMIEGVILGWRKQPGDPVEKDEILFDVETDKVTVEIRSPATGQLRDVSAAEGDTIPVGQVIARIEE